LSQHIENTGDPGWIRTSDPQLRRLVLKNITRSVRLSAAAKSGRDGEALSERENLFYNLPGCSGPVHGFSGVACKTLPFEIVEKTI
jgi:hypothetical protein